MMMMEDLYGDACDIVLMAECTVLMISVSSTHFQGASRWKTTVCSEGVRNGVGKQSRIGVPKQYVF